MIEWQMFLLHHSTPQTSLFLPFENVWECKMESYEHSSWIKNTAIFIILKTTPLNNILSIFII